MIHFFIFRKNSPESGPAENFCGFPDAEAIPARQENTSVVFLERKEPILFCVMNHGNWPRAFHRAKEL